VYKNTLDSEFKLLKETLEEEQEMNTQKEETKKQKSTINPEISKFISTSQSVIDNTTNADIIKGILDSLNTKIPMATDIEQMNQLGELKQKAETKLASVKNIRDISESINASTEIMVGDNVVFEYNGNIITGKVMVVNTINGNTVYDIISWNYDKNKNDLYKNVDITKHKIEKVQDDESNLTETCSVGATSSGGVAGYAKALGKPKKRKKATETFDVKLFKESIINELPTSTIINEHELKYFLYENKFYLSIDNSLVKTYDKGVMLNAVDKICEGNYKDIEVLKDYSCYEMNILMETEEI
jgi:hypothetical protein